MLIVDLIRQGEDAEQAGDLAAATTAYRAAADSDDSGTVAQALFRLGRVAWRQGRYDTAVESLERALALALQSGDTELRARVENGIGAVHYARGAYGEARKWYRSAIAHTGDRAMRARTSLNLGVIANIEGALDDARAHYEESRGVFAQVGDRDGEALALHNLGMLHADRRQWPEARAAYARCAELFEQLGNEAMLASVRVNHSELLIQCGDLAGAVAECDRAIEVLECTGDEVGRGEALHWKGHALRRLGAVDEAERLLSEAVRIAHRTHARLLEAEASRELGGLRAAAGNAGDARRWYLRALSLFRELGASREEAELRAELGGGADEAP